MVVQHGAAHLPGLVHPGRLALQQQALPGQGLLQGDLPRLHGPDGVHRHLQLPQQADLLQRLHILVRVIPVVVLPALGVQKPLLLIVADVGTGDPQLLLDLTDVHRRPPSRIRVCYEKSIRCKAGSQSSVFRKIAKIPAPGRGTAPPERAGGSP